MTNFNLKKTLKEFYLPSQKEFSIVDVPVMNFLMIDGHGDPNISSEYQKAVETLYAMAYSIKFQLKPQGFEYSVSPLEGLWWMEDMSQFSMAVKDQWKWTMMIMQPPFVTEASVELARSEVQRKKKPDNLHKIRFAPFIEGLAVQILYQGAYADEGPTITRMHAFVQANGYQLRGKHHEIYLSDPRRIAAEKLKTVIRQPIQIVPAMH